MRSFGGVLRGRLRLGGMLFREGRVGLGVQYIYVWREERRKRKRACLGWLVSS